MTRFITVDPDKYGEFVDLKKFNKAIQEAQGANDVLQVAALESMKKEGVVGFTYLYNHEKRDDKFHKRAQILRKNMQLQEDQEIWEMNFWSVPGTKDAPVEEGARQTLSEFTSTLVNDTVTVMFADAEEIKEEYKDALEKPLRLQDIALDQSILEKVAEVDQDSRILGKLGYTFVDRIRYDDNAKYLDLAYAKTLQVAETIK